MDVHVIAFDPPTILLQKLQRLFPEAHTKHKQAVNLKNVPVKHLVTNNLITFSTENSIMNGRKWHHEHATQGGIGLIHAVRLSLNENNDRPLLILEEDCILRDEQTFLITIRKLLVRIDDFDMAVFGIFHTYQRQRQHVAYLPKNWFHVEDRFWGMHCVLYSPKARAKLGRLLLGPAEMQIDSYCGNLARYKRLKIIGESSRRLAVQSTHSSSIQKFDLLGKGHMMVHLLCILIVLYILVHKYSTWCRTTLPFLR